MRMSFAVRPDCLNTFGAIAEKPVSVISESGLLPLKFVTSA